MKIKFTKPDEFKSTPKIATILSLLILKKNKRKLILIHDLSSYFICQIENYQSLS